MTTVGDEIRHALEYEFFLASRRGDALIVRTLGHAGVHRCDKPVSKRELPKKDLERLYWQAYDLGMDEKSESFKILALLAIKGYRNTREILGTNLHEGIGVQRDQRLALYWLMRAQLEGDNFASYGIGRVYVDRRHGLRSYADAVLWLEQSIRGRGVNELAKATLAKVLFDDREWYWDPMRARRLLQELISKRSVYKLTQMFSGYARLQKRVNACMGERELPERGLIRGCWVVDFKSKIPEWVLTGRQAKAWRAVCDKYAGRKLRWNKLVASEKLGSDLLARIRPYITRPIVHFPQEK